MTFGPPAGHGITYDPALLTPVTVLTVTDRERARTWVRYFLRDIVTPQGGSVGNSGRAGRRDVEYDAALELDAVRVNGVAYYRPHVTAAAVYRGDPEAYHSRSVGGTTEVLKARPVDEVVAPWLEQGAQFDALLPVLTPAEPAPSRRGQTTHTPIVVEGI